MTNLSNQYNPDAVSAPGETLQEMLIDRGMTQTELAERLGLTHKTVNEIIKGKAPISHDTALALETVLGAPASFWNRYEAAYRESIARNELNRQIISQVSWLKDMPWKEAAKMGYLEERQSPSDQLLEVLRFFSVASPDKYNELYRKIAIQWRAPSKYQPNADAVAFWLRMGEVDATELPERLGISYSEHNARVFEKCLGDARKLTSIPDPVIFVAELQRICAKAGVAVVFVPELTGTHACGAARWLAPTKALIQLSLRYKTNDSLWFSFFHEAAHILKHSKKATFLDLEVRQQATEEAEADRFAQDFLIPARDYVRFVSLGTLTKASVEDFALDIGVHPGIVVGRLQHENVIPRNWFNDLKQRYVWHL